MELLGEITIFLNRQWETFISNFGLLATLGAVLYFVLQKTIEHGFQKQLTRLKGEIDHEVLNDKKDGNRQREMEVSKKRWKLTNKVKASNKIMKKNMFYGNIEF